MLCMVSYSRRPQSGQITCYLNRTYHVLPTAGRVLGRLENRSEVTYLRASSKILSACLSRPSRLVVGFQQFFTLTSPPTRWFCHSKRTFTEDSSTHGRYCDS